METQICFKKNRWDCLVRSALLIIAFFFRLYDADCQKPDVSPAGSTGGSYENTFSTSRIGMAQSVMTTPRSEFHFVVQHRFNDIRSGKRDFFGIDFAVTRIGFEYGLTDWLSAGIGRSLSVKTYDLELKASIFKQNQSNIPVSLSYYISVLDNTSPNYFPEGHSSFGSRLSYVNQVFVARNQGIFSFQVSPLWLHNTYEVRTAGASDIFAVDLDGRISLAEKLGLIAEYIPILTNEPFTKTFPLTLGLDINTGGHQFQVFFSNAQGTNENMVLTNTIGKWSKGHIFIGFNLTRVFHSNMD
jgi:Membrane bound beta barrel domain (DUF5777)